MEFKEMRRKFFESNAPDYLMWLALLLVIIAFIYLPMGVIQYISNPYTRHVAELDHLDDGRIELVNDAGETVRIDVKIADTSESRRFSFRDVDPEIIEETVLYCIYGFRSSTPFSGRNIKADLDVAFFDMNGDLLEIFEIDAHDERGFAPEERYSYAIMARRGFFEENGITSGGGASLSPGSLEEL